MDGGKRETGEERDRGRETDRGRERRNQLKGVPVFVSLPPCSLSRSWQPSLVDRAKHIDPARYQEASEGLGEKLLPLPSSPPSSPPSLSLPLPPSPLLSPTSLSPALLLLLFLLLLRGGGSLVRGWILRQKLYQGSIRRGLDVHSTQRHTL